MKKKHKLGCLFGSGISIKANYLNVNDITKVILEGKFEKNGASLKAYHHTDQETYLVQQNFTEYMNDHYLERVLPFINNVYLCLKDYFNAKQYICTPNYEDLYNFIRQIKDEISKEQDNYGLFCSLPILKEKLISDIITENYLVDRISNNLLSISNDSLIYITNIVQRLLNKQNDKSEWNYLSILNDLIKKNMSTIFTLNHDTLLEQYFDENGIEYCDGFSEKDGDTFHFKEESFNMSTTINLIKLHGSVNWFILEDEKGRATYSKPLTNDYHHIESSNGNYFYKSGYTNQMLVGSFNKLTDYNFGIFDTLFSEFTIRLREIQVLIISGYSFGDKGVNGKLKYWFNEDQNRKIIIIHPNKDDLLRRCRGMIFWMLDNESKKTEDNRRINIIEKKFEDLLIEDIDSILNKINKDCQLD